MRAIIEDFTKINFHRSFLLSGVCTIINVHTIRIFIPVLLMYVPTILILQCVFVVNHAQGRKS